MCGLCGLFSPHSGGVAGEAADGAIQRMTRGLARRGPDDESFWSDPEGRLRLGFRRLAILDLSPAGNQPMETRSGRTVLVMNGEIYNFRELRRELEDHGHVFRSTGDAEVVAEALEHWGEDALERLHGMFALAWFDREARRLTLARDRAGIKPLYLLETPHGLAFGSHFDTVLEAPWLGNPEIDPEVLRLYLRLAHVPPPRGLVRGTRQLAPGRLLRVDADGDRAERAFWTLPRTPRVDLGADEAGPALERALERAVDRHRLADVPLGVFLSGGVDSPLVSAIARGQTSAELLAFTLGNPGWGQDEEKAAGRWAEAIGVDHRIARLEGGALAESLGDARAAMHEPFGDFSLLPTLALSRFARQHVTVALSGDGGDELFFGYERPRSLLRDGPLFRWPLAVRRALWAGGRLGAPGGRRSDAVLFKTPGHYYEEVSARTSTATLEALAPGLPPAPREIYRSEPWRPPGERRQLAHFSRFAEFHGQLQRCLKKVDMASMHHSLEVRVPLLDVDVLETSLRIDPMISLSGGQRKRLLRDLLAQRVPEADLQTRKLGFGIPLGDLLRGPLRKSTEETLFDAPLYPEGLLRRPAVERLWHQHLEKKIDAKWTLWTLLALQWWAERVGLRR
ncbi:MAG: asparagine synthase (glutamine-hydrolyzing) [Acidobacteriota bacterium]